MEALAFGVLGAGGAAFASPYLLGRFSSAATTAASPTAAAANEPYDVDYVTRQMAMNAQSTKPPLQQSAQAHELDNGGLSAPSREQRDCLQNFLHDNSAQGRPDNLAGLTTTVYKPQEHRMDLFTMPGDDMLSWGIVPQGGGRNGGFRPEWNSAHTLKPPKREVTQEQMYAPEGDANKQWGEVQLRGMQWARDDAANTKANKAHAARGAMDDYTPFDFEGSEARGIAGRVMPQGTARGRYWTQRHGAVVGSASGGAGFGDGTRIVYPGDLKKGLVQYSLRPIANNGSTIGGPVKPAEQYRHKGKWAERFSVAEYTRPPVRETAVGIKQQAAVGDVSMRCTNRQMPLRCDKVDQYFDAKGDDHSSLIAGKARLTEDYYSM